MLACSAELVLATHKTVILLFPAVLERTGITAFDLSKVIESFVRNEETLPRELRRHLNSLEERLLESIVWEKGSSLYNTLIVARPAFSSEVNYFGLLADPIPSLDTVAAHNNISCRGLPPLSFLHKHDISQGQSRHIQSPKRICGDHLNLSTSPAKDPKLTFKSPKLNLSPLPLQSAFASPTHPNLGGGVACAAMAINVFFNKIVKLAAVRIYGLVKSLQLPQQIRETVQCLLQQILSRRSELFFRRHIDQIILCCFYGVAKISQLSLTFKEIIHAYRKQPQCKPQIFRHVFIDWSSSHQNGKTGQEHVDIISFYNEIFVPSVKSLLVAVHSASATSKAKQLPEPNHDIDGTGKCPGSPRPPPFPSLPDLSPKKLSPAHNVYVSPLRSSKVDALITLPSKSYYACVGESTRAYQSPSKDLTAINNHLNGKVNTKLDFDNVAIVSDSLVSSSLHGESDSDISAPITTAAATTSNSLLDSKQSNNTSD